MGRLFGTSGVRGVVGKDVTPELAMELGFSVATQLHNAGTVVVGRDTRTTSEMLENCLISGLLSGGCDVKRLGVVPTSAVSFATCAQKAKAGVMVTASHNPPEYNGFKLFDSSGMSYMPQLEGKVESIFFGKLWTGKPWNEIGKVEELEVLPAYLKVLAAAVKVAPGYKVVVDCGNGAGSAVTPPLLKELGCKVKLLNCRPDGTFPGRHPEPSPENLKELCRLVRSTHADLGIAHDGDADRVVIVDETGEVVKGDEVLALMAAHMMEGNGRPIVTTVDASGAVDEFVKGRGGKLARTKVGDVSVAVEIKRRDAVFGGEPSGAWIFPDINIAPDGPLGAAKVLELLSASGKTMSQLLDALPEYHTAREKVSCKEARKSVIMGEATRRLRKEFGRGAAILKMDGVRLDFDGGWLLVRPSGTEPYIRVTAEGRTPDQAKDIVKRTVKLLKKSRRRGRWIFRRR